MESLNYPDRDYLFIVEHDDGSFALSFNIEDDDILALGEEMNEVRNEAYMNGYNWEAFINYYLAANAPEVCKGMETDSEAGTYVVYYEDGASNCEKVKRLADIIISLVENKEEIFKILREHGDEIEWD
ncbi:MAG: immunity 51 family protein [Muribaculaceae bacterium]|nr:immunity 51 family protein [Muribaculaceae bacterium]MDE6552257.1 immunity 51 family protein [Muribaculaceae bacterium]